MKKIGFLAILLLDLLLVASCTKDSPVIEETGETTEVQTEAPETEPPLPPNVFKAPSVEEARQIVIDYAKKMARVKWVCKRDMDFTKGKSYTASLYYTAGETYYGIPYVSSRGYTEKFEILLDSDRVYTGPITYETCIGNSCATAVRVSYDQVSPKVEFSSSFNIYPVANMGTVQVGEYEWGEIKDLSKFASLDVCHANGTQKIYEAYALLQPADAISERDKSGSSYTGHARLISSLPNVVYDNTGKINGSRSSIKLIEQTSSFDKTNTEMKTTWKIDKEFTFANLYSGGYLPLTLEEFVSGDIPDLTIDFIDTDEDLLMTKKSVTGIVKSNYLVKYIGIFLYDKEGNVVSKAEYAPSKAEVSLGGQLMDPIPSTLPDGEYRLVIKARAGWADYTYCDKTIVKKS